MIARVRVVLSILRDHSSLPNRANRHRPHTHTQIHTACFNLDVHQRPGYRVAPYRCCSLSCRDSVNLATHFHLRGIYVSIVGLAQPSGVAGVFPFIFLIFVRKEECHAAGYREVQDTPLLLISGSGFVIRKKRRNPPVHPPPSCHTRTACLVESPAREPYRTPESFANPPKRSDIPVRLSPVSVSWILLELKDFGSRYPRKSWPQVFRFLALLLYNIFFLFCQLEQLFAGPYFSGFFFSRVAVFALAKFCEKRFLEKKYHTILDGETLSTRIASLENQFHVQRR